MKRPLVLLFVLAGCDGALTGGLSEPVVTVDPTPPTPTTPARLDCSSKRHAAATTLRRLTTTQYQRAIGEIFAGRVQPSAAWPGPVGVSATGYTTEESVNEIGEQGATQLIRAADDVAVGVGGALGELLPCSRLATAGQACFETYLGSVGRRAFRRSLTTDETAALQAVYDSAIGGDASFVDAIAIVTATILQSPQFLYVVEDAAGTGRALRGAELASRLSFFFWDSVPDDELLAIAESGALADPNVLAAQARRLLESSKADPAIARYFREWTQARTLIETDKDQTVFPRFDGLYAKSLGESFDRFVVAQVRAHASMESLFTSTDLYVDEHLAPAHGVPAPAPGSWLKISLERSKASGLFTQPLLLASNAHPTEASFVFRGRMIQKRFLCTQFSTPPANALSVFDSLPKPTNPTARESAASIESNPICGGCHKALDPPGLAFEHYDAIGQWRDRDAQGRTIDPRGELIGVGDEPVRFESAGDLAALLAKRPQAIECTSRQLFRFAFSRAETDADACALQSLGDALADTRGDVGAAMLALTATDAFTWRVDP